MLLNLTTTGKSVSRCKERLPRLKEQYLEVRFTSFASWVFSVSTKALVLAS